MEKLQTLENKIKAAVQLIGQQREKNAKLETQYQKLIQENSFLLSENKQVSQLRVELQKLKESQSKIRQKCQKLLEQYEAMKL